MELFILDKRQTREVISLFLRLIAGALRLVAGSGALGGVGARAVVLRVFVVVVLPGVL